MSIIKQAEKLNNTESNNYTEIDYTITEATPTIIDICISYKGHIKPEQKEGYPFYILNIEELTISFITSTDIILYIRLESKRNISLKDNIVVYLKESIEADISNKANIIKEEYPYILIQSLLKHQNINPISTPKYSPDTANTLSEKDIINWFKYEDKMNIIDKLLMTRYIKNNVKSLSQEFIEEECHLSLVNWIYRSKNEISNCYLLEMIDNIVYILYALEIDVVDIVQLDMYVKVNKFKGYLLKFVQYFLNFSYIYINLLFLIDIWKERVNIYNASLLNKKRLCFDEAKEDTAEDSDYLNININTNTNRKYLKIKSKQSIKSNKSKSVSFDLKLNQKVTFSPDDEPCLIGESKYCYDPLFSF